MNSINGIEFKNREVEVISCLINGRGPQKISDLLFVYPTKLKDNIKNISQRTVEFYIRQIFIKLDINSTVRIIDIVEQTKEYEAIKSYYPYIVYKAKFANKLLELSSLYKEKGITCSIHSFQSTQETEKLFVSNLKSHLTGLGIECIEELIATTGDVKNPKSCNMKLYVLCKQFAALPDQDKFLQSLNRTSGKVLLLVTDKEAKELIPADLKDVEIIDFTEQEQYHKIFFELLKKVLPYIDCGTIETFDKIIHTESNVTRLSNPDLPKDPIHKPTVYTKKYRSLWIAANFLIPLLFIGLFWLPNKHNEISAEPQTVTSSITSDLPIPSPQTFLQRPEILQKLDKGFHNSKGIQTIALVGIGGAGKTTLARQYARLKSAAVVWEINAETQNSLFESFEKLAQTLSNTEEDQEALRNIKKIQEFIERENALISFIKTRLKSQKSWFLIYDNVDNFTNIQKYFPMNSSTWGKGNIILTTQNFNISNNESINHVIQIEGISDTQKLSLFTQITSHGENHKQQEIQEKETLEILKQIPPFPLDVSVAAYYLKTANISYAKYLEYLNQQDGNFTALQKELLQESGGYTKTRYSIISLSLEKLLDTHKDFGELLLLISLIDSQNIPQELLNQYKDNIVVDKFIYHLKKYSLIADEASLPSSDAAFSLHRGAQSVMLAYLSKSLNLQENKQLIQSIAVNLENYISEATQNGMYPKSYLLISHLKMLLSHDELLTDFARSVINLGLGSAYAYSYHTLKAQKSLSKALKILNKNPKENALKIADGLYLFGMEHFD